MLKNAEKRWQKLERIPVHHGQIFKIENEEKIVSSEPIPPFSKMLFEKKKLYSFSIHTEQEKNNANQSKLILLEDDATRFEDFKSDLFSGIWKVPDFE